MEGATAELKAYPHLPIAFSPDFTRGHSSSSKNARSIGRQPHASTVAQEDADTLSIGVDLAEKSHDAPLQNGDCGQQSDLGAVNGAAQGACDEWPPGTTSVMLRNIPNRYTPEELLEEVVQKGFEGAFDFFYLPTDFGTKKNMGYGFLNLRSPPLAESFRRAFDRKRLTRYVTQKVLEMSPALTQGFEANVLKYLKHQAGRVQNPWFRPMIFVPNEGSGSPWCCMSLCEEHLPEHIRRLAAAPPSAREALRSKGHEDPPVVIDEDEGGSEAGNISDAETAVAMQAAVSKFLRDCGDPGRNGFTSIPSTIESLSKAPLTTGVRARTRRQRGKQLRDHVGDDAVIEGSSAPSEACRPIGS